MTTLLDIQGRRTVGYLTNKSGGAVVKGDVVILDSSNDEAFTTSTVGAEVVGVGVVTEENGIANNAAGRIAFQGYVDLVNVNASVTRGHFGKTHTVAKQSTDAGASRVLGVFCEFLKSGTSPSAMLFGQPDGVTGAGGLSGGTPALTLGTSNSAGAASTGIRTDATIAAFDATVPVTQALGDAAAAGSAGVAARRDHKHAMPSVDNVLPWRIDVLGILGGNPMTNWALASAGNQYGGKVMQSTGAQNDEISFDLTIAAGTWTFTLLYYKHTICGIYTVSIDGSSIGTIDSYNGSESPNAISSITGVSVASSAKHTVKLKMATKNASASNYYGIWTAFALIRTA